MQSRKSLLQRHGCVASPALPACTAPCPQLMSFPLFFQKVGAWTSILSAPIGDDTFSHLIPIAVWVAFTWMVLVIGLFVALTALVARQTVILAAKSPLVRPLRTLLWLSSGVLLIPISRVLMHVFECGHNSQGNTTSERWIAGEGRCWSSAHLIACTVVGGAFLSFSSIVLMMSGALVFENW